MDDSDIATGFYIANPEVSIFEARIGTAFEKIDEVLGMKGDVVLDRAETRYSINVHYAENYRITYSADSKEGPVENIMVVRGK